MTSTDELVLRPASEDDESAVVSVYLSARRNASMPPSVHSEDEIRQWIGGRLRSEDDFWVAESAQQVVGYARLATDWLDDLYVAAPFAGHGIGSALLDLAKSLRPQGFCLWVFESNTGARRFYERHGLVELEHTDGAANEERSPDIRFAWLGEQPLVFLRSLIDAIDDELAGLLARRAALTAAVQQQKEVPGRAGRDAERERAIAERMARQVPALGAERIQRIMHAIITESLDAGGSA